MDKNYKIVEEAADIAFQIASKYMFDTGVISKDGKDIKTEADFAINSAIIKLLQSTGIPILSEESINTSYHLLSPCWVVDPIDGTYNLSRGFPFSSFSICLWENNEPVIGLVRNLFDGKTYLAKNTFGMYCEGKQMKVSRVGCITDATIATGFPSGLNYSVENLSKILSFVQKFKKVRAIGSASLMLSHVASGIFDVYYEKDIYLWDVLAGLALVKEAGGRYYLKRTPNSFKCEVLASNDLLHEEALNELMQ